ncbi:MAG TPA: competence/damage-inducible protein A [Solirubrobacteraceae bacterium]|nr:competence/damage-inducible protein A [Solirubrobacteraceae bacterium]
MSPAAPGTVPRAGILVTGTEVLSGIISDRNGPWLSERLRELGVDPAMIEIVGDRPADLRVALEGMRAAGMSLIVTSGGLGPTADDLTAEIVGRFCGREMVLDEALEQCIADIVRPLMKRWPDVDEAAVRRANRKQAVVPEGATVLEPVGTAPGLVVPPAAPGTGPVEGGLTGPVEGPTVVVLPGPPGELRPMWETAVRTEAFRAATAGATRYERQIVRLYGLPESEIAASLEAASGQGLELHDLEITTCLRRGEIEIATRYEPPARQEYDALLGFLRDRHGAMLFSEDGSTVDDQVAELLLAQDASLAVAESCTAGLLAARLTERAGSSAYFLGGGVVYSNEAKTLLAGVPQELIARDGAVSESVARALASGIATRLGASFGVGITGIAGPGGGTPEKPVGLVCISVWSAAHGRGLTRAPRMPGSRADIRDRSVTVAMHLLRRLLLGATDGGSPAGG